MKVTKQTLERILYGGGADLEFRPIDIVKSHLELIESVEKFLPGFRRIAAFPCQNNGAEGVQGVDGCSSCLARKFLIEMGEGYMVAGFDWAAPGTSSLTEKCIMPPHASEAMVMLDTIEEKKFNFKQKHGYSPQVLLISERSLGKIMKYLKPSTYPTVDTKDPQVLLCGLEVETSRKNIDNKTFVSLDL